MHNRKLSNAKIVKFIYITLSTYWEYYYLCNN